MKFIETKKAPAAVGPYSQAVEANGTLYVSGQIPFVPETMTLVGPTIQEQTKQSLDNIKAIVEEAGYKVENIVKCQVFLKDMNDFTYMNKVYEDFFDGHKPARCAVEVSRLPKDVKVEIDAVCVK
ncbi:MAG: RidA family protein [Tissierellales bacterium]|jgi:2-iminobutanoate/2-iminopropanoate deaminase|nr:RidA family protein [Tissierellales bacterium]HCX03542.1 reactive intermediate/imine deaminase [Clostridiales bacterium]